MHIGFMIQNEAMRPHGELLMKSLARTAYESVRIMVPVEEMELVLQLRQQYPEKTVIVEPFSMPDAYRKFPFADKLVGAEKAEAMVDGTLMWMDTDSIVFGDLSPLDLKEGEVFAYRPVDKKLIGCGPEEPLSAFWQHTYMTFNLDKEFASMKTGVEQEDIRPYFNAGCFLLKTDRKILQFWKDVFFSFIEREEIQSILEEEILYKIFAHQVIFTGAVLASTKREERVLLPDAVNYPIQFHGFHPLSDSVKTSMNLISGRYDTYFNQDESEWNFPFDDETASWIDVNALQMGWFYE